MATIDDIIFKTYEELTQINDVVDLPDDAVMRVDVKNLGSRGVSAKIVAEKASALSLAVIQSGAITTIVEDAVNFGDLAAVQQARQEAQDAATLADQYRSDAQDILTQVQQALNDIQNFDTTLAQLEGYNVELDHASDVRGVAIYDTRADYDGGNWRKKCQDRSWYNEPFSGTRGSKKEFPQVALVVSLIGGEVRIYDLDNVTAPLWMVFECAHIFHMLGGHESTADKRYIRCLDGVIAVCDVVEEKISYVDFIRDRGLCYSSTSALYAHGGNIAERNDPIRGYENPGGMVAEMPWLQGATAFYDVSLFRWPGIRGRRERLGIPMPSFSMSTSLGCSVWNEALGGFVDTTWAFTRSGTAVDGYFVYARSAAHVSDAIGWATFGEVTEGDWATRRAVAAGDNGLHCEGFINYQIAEMDDHAVIPFYYGGMSHLWPHAAIGRSMICNRGMAHFTGVMSGAAEVCMCDTVAELGILEQANTNNKYSSGLASDPAWVMETGTYSIVGGEMVSDNPGAFRFYKDVDVVRGRRYRVRARCSLPSGTGTPRIEVFDRASNVHLRSHSQEIPAGAEGVCYVTALDDQIRVVFHDDDTGNTGGGALDYIYVEEVVANWAKGNYSYDFDDITIHGQVLRNTFNSGEIASYTGFSDVNYIEVGDENLIDLEEEWWLSIWFGDTHPTLLEGPLIGITDNISADFSGSAEMGLRAYGTSGQLVFTIAGSSILYFGGRGSAHKIDIVYRKSTGYLYAYMDGVLTDRNFGQIHLGNLKAALNANCKWQIGRCGTGAYPHDLAKPMIARAAPTEDFIRKAYEFERPVFVDGEKLHLEREYLYEARPDRITGGVLVNAYNQAYLMKGAGIHKTLTATGNFHYYTAGIADGVVVSRGYSGKAHAVGDPITLREHVMDTGRQFGEVSKNPVLRGISSNVEITPIAVLEGGASEQQTHLIQVTAMDWRTGLVDFDGVYSVKAGNATVSSTEVNLDVVSGGPSLSFQALNSEMANVAIMANGVANKGYVWETKILNRDYTDNGR